MYKLGKSDDLAVSNRGKKMTVLEKEVKELKNEVRGLRSLVMELVDPDAGLELTDAVKKRISAARKSNDFLSTDNVLQELGA